MTEPENDPDELIKRLRRVSDAEAAMLRQQDPKVEQRQREWLAAAKLPRRHCERKGDEIDRSGEWGRRETEIRGRVGSGFLIALTGGRGPGKTQMAVEIAKHSIRMGRPALYTTATELLMEIKATYRKDSKESEADVLQRHRRAKLLIVDEYSRRAETDWEDRLLFDLINKRYNDISDTFIVANCEPAKIAEALGPSIASRLNEVGGVIHCNWQSYREP